MMLFTFIGCASPPFRTSANVDEPTPLAFTDLRARQVAPKLAVVLSGGGMRGFAHVGVLNVLAEYGIAPDLIVGSSAGALVGVLYAQHHDLPKLRNDAFAISPEHFASPALPLLPMLSWLPGSLGLLHFDRFESFLEKRLGTCKLEQLKPRTLVVASDLQTGNAVAFDRGDCARALHASSAIPGVAVPVRIGSSMYVDGQIASPLPVAAAKALGAITILAVNVVYAPVGSALEHYPSVFMQGWNSTIYALSMLQAQHADIVISPQFRTTSQLGLADREDAIVSGETAMRHAIPALKILLDSKREAAQAERN